jgi:hypothetical protein
MLSFSSIIKKLGDTKMIMSCKRIFFKAMILCLVIIPASIAFAVEPVPGDVNGDGKVDLDDVNLVAAVTIGNGNLTLQEADFNNNGIIDVGDVVIVTNMSNSTTPTPTSTPVPTPTPGGDTFDIENYFLLTPNSLWSYEHAPGASDEDDFDWQIDGTTKTAPDTKEVTPIKYIVKDPGDDREGDEDFWYLDENGDLWFYGFHKGIKTSKLAGDKDNWMTVPLKAGGRNMQIGDEVVSNGTASVWILILDNPVQQTVPVTSTVRYTRRENVSTHLGGFNDTIRVELDITVAGESIRANTFWLRENVGMVMQDQTPDQNDAEAHSLAGGNVGGTPIVADSPPIAPPVK